MTGDQGPLEMDALRLVLRGSCCNFRGRFVICGAPRCHTGPSDGPLFVRREQFGVASCPRCSIGNGAAASWARVPGRRAFDGARRGRNRVALQLGVELPCDAINLSGGGSPQLAGTVGIGIGNWTLRGRARRQVMLEMHLSGHLGEKLRDPTTSDTKPGAGIASVRNTSKTSASNARILLEWIERGMMRGEVRWGNSITILQIVRKWVPDF